MSASAGRDVYGLARFYTIDLAPGTDVLTAVADYAADPNVELAEPDYIVPLNLVPNDPNYGDQYTHFNVQDEDIDTQEAWDLETGDSTVIIGVIDSGIQHDHPDLEPNVWVNPGEDLDGDGIPWDSDDQNGVDDDGNGLVDDLIGWDFMPAQAQGECDPLEDCNGPDNNPIDFNGHGTHCNGIVASVTGNGTGGAGIAGGNRLSRRPGVKLMGLRAGYEGNDGNGYIVMTAAAAAMDYAVAKGAMGVNCSWGSSGSTIRTAALNAVANGLVVCKAAGNDNWDTPGILDTTFGVLAVANVDNWGVRASSSNFGTWVDISAPGSAIFNTYSSSGVASYATIGGTSMASPTVLGVAALLKSHHPWFTKTQIDTLLLNHTDFIDDQNPTYAGQLGTGRVNAYSSLSVLTTADYSIDVAFGDAPLAVNFTNTSPNAVAPFEYDFGDGNTDPGPSVLHTYTTPGVYDVTFTGDGPSGTHTRSNPAQIVVVRDTIEYGDTTGLSVGNRVPISVRLNNTHAMPDITLPFKMIGPANIRLDSLKLTALTANWTNDRAVAGNTESVWRLTAGSNGTPIPPGGGIIAHVWITVVSGTNGDIETVDSATIGFDQYDLRLLSQFADFKPKFVGGMAVIGSLCDCSCHGDPVCDGNLDVSDVVKVIDAAFRGLPDTQDPGCTHVGRADLNCDCAVDVLDVSGVIERAFRGNSTPVCDACSSPCP